MKTIRLVTPDRWVACSAREFGPVGTYRHIVRTGGLTTVCGATATVAAIWRGNTTKPRCKQCTTLYGTRKENR